MAIVPAGCTRSCVPAGCTVLAHAPPAEVVPPSPTLTVYQYHNSEHPGFSRQLWVREGEIMQGRHLTAVMYVSRQGHTPWHGDFVRLEPRMASLRFDYDGRQDNIKQVILVGMDGGGFSGVDYAGRKITLTKITSFVWDMNTLWWNPLV